MIEQLYKNVIYFAIQTQIVMLDFDLSYQSNILFYSRRFGISNFDNMHDTKNRVLFLSPKYSYSISIRNINPTKDFRSNPCDVWKKGRVQNEPNTKHVARLSFEDTWQRTLPKESRCEK